MAEGGADPRYLIGRDADADAVAADQDPPLEVAPGHGLGHEAGEVGVVAEGVVVGAEVVVGVA